MKNILIILFGITCLTASLGDSFTLLVFKLNQEYIATNLCVEKDQQINTCQGCCLLKKQLEKNNDQDQTNPNQKEQKLIIDFFWVNQHPNTSPSYSCLITFSFITRNTNPVKLFGVFHPPQMM